MQHRKVFASFALAAGMALAGASAVLAEEPYRDFRDIRHDREDVRHDYTAVDRLRADIARDQWRLDRDIRAGCDREAAADVRQLARDRRAISALGADIRHDRRDAGRDYRDEWRGR